jgi:plasmid maintenance system antidote protein VapI
MKPDNYIERIIKAEIRKAGESQNSIAVKTGVTRDILCRFMQGTRGISTDSAAALLDYFGYRITKDKG